MVETLGWFMDPLFDAWSRVVTGIVDSGITANHVSFMDGPQMEGELWFLQQNAMQHTSHWHNVWHLMRCTDLN